MGKNKKTAAKQATQNTGLNRRWFADMSGWGVSLQVGSGERPKQRRSLPVSIEQKFITVPLSIGAATHNTLYTFNPLSVITLGTGANNRIGAGIKLNAISFRGVADSSGQASNSIWRFLLVASAKQFTAANFGSGLGFTDLFFSSSTGTGLAHVDSRVAKVLCDMTVATKPSVTGVTDSEFVNFDCELNTRFEFQTGGVYGSMANLYLVVTPYVPEGTSGTSVAGTLIGEVLVSWSD